LRSTPKDPDEQREWRYALRLLGVRERSENELRERLSRRGADNAAIDAIVQRLYHYRYLDDARFAEGMARRALRRGHGSRRLRADLAAKGIAKAHIDTAVDQTFVDEADLARRALNKRYKTVPNDDASRARAARFLLQRGFPQRLVLAILKEGC
jgi:regulatory protein